ncbi:unnamed protein product [Ixodes pacificus]
MRWATFGDMTAKHYKKKLVINRALATNHVDRELIPQFVDAADLRITVQETCESLSQTWMSQEAISRMQGATKKCGSLTLNSHATGTDTTDCRCDRLAFHGAINTQETATNSRVMRKRYHACRLRTRNVRTRYELACQRNGPRRLRRQQIRVSRCDKHAGTRYELACHTYRYRRSCG